jgi:ABC-type uncharacterized transport system permease subunit
MESLLLSDRGFLWLAAVAYAVAFILALWSILRRHQHSKGILLTIVAIGFLLQTAGLYIRGHASGSCPLNNQFEITQFMGWSATLLYLVIGPAFRLSLLGFFTSAIVAIISLVSLMIPGWDATQTTSIFGSDPWIKAHASLATFSYGVMGILAITSAMQLLQNYSLKKKRMRGLFPYLPSIVELKQINPRLLSFGLSLLTFSILVGIFYTSEPTQSPKLLLSSAIWIGYLIVFIIRRFRLLSSNNLALICILLFLAAVLSLGTVANSIGNSEDLENQSSLKE